VAMVSSPWPSIAPRGDGLTPTKPYVGAADSQNKKMQIAPPARCNIALALIMLPC